MAIKYKINCTVCQRCKRDPKLRARIYAAYYKQDEGDERVNHIAREIGINVQPMYNHCRKHISERTSVVPLITERRIEEMKAKVAKTTELALDHDSIVVKEDYEQVLDGVLAEGLAQMKQGNKTITISQLIAAAKIKGDFHAKRRGQDVELIKSMYRYNTGDKNEHSSRSTPPATG